MSSTNQATALATAKERSGVSGVADSVINDLLTMTVGTDGSGVTHYRGYYVAAKLIEQNRGDQTLSAADGAQFTGLAVTIASLLGLQQGYDEANGLIVPDAFKAALPRKRGTRSYTPRLVP